MLDVRRLHMLRELSERGTIAATAGALGYSAPAVSQHLAALERQVGVALLERQGRRVVLTPAARLLVGRTERVLAELEAAEAELAAGSGDVRGSVRLAAFPTAAATLVPRAMATFAARHPGAEVLLSELEPEAALPALKLGEADLAVIHEYDFSPRGEDPSSSSRRSPRTRSTSPCPPGTRPPARRSRSASWPPSAGSPATSTPPATAWWSPRAAPPASSRASSRAPTTSASCWPWWPPGQGVALVPGLAVDRLPDGVCLARPAERRLARRVVGAVRAGSGGHPAVAALLEALREAAGHTLAARA